MAEGEVRCAVTGGERIAKHEAQSELVATQRVPEIRRRTIVLNLSGVLVRRYIFAAQGGAEGVRALCDGKPMTARLIAETLLAQSKRGVELSIRTPATHTTTWSSFASTYTAYRTSLGADGEALLECFPDLVAAVTAFAAHLVIRTETTPHSTPPTALDATTQDEHLGDISGFHGTW